jgi:hypothetical protein
MPSKTIAIGPYIAVHVETATADEDWEGGYEEQSFHWFYPR